MTENQTAQTSVRRNRLAAAACFAAALITVGVVGTQSATAAGAAHRPAATAQPTAAAHQAGDGDPGGPRRRSPAH
ncbi:hypothetical protein ABZW03_24025, partial [Kitasatospora sp. NPDC004799]